MIEVHVQGDTRDFLVRYETMEDARVLERIDPRATVIGEAEA